MFLAQKRQYKRNALSTKARSPKMGKISAVHTYKMENHISRAIQRALRVQKSKATSLFFCRGIEEVCNFAMILGMKRGG